MVAHETKDWLRQFVEDRSEEAFAALVRLHIDLVYGTALRRCWGDAALAEDVTQIVFADLARKAADLPDHVVLAGWLHRHTTFVASSLIRTERRRRQRESLAMEFHQRESSPDWSAVGPVLDEALQELPEPDRNALILRFLEKHTFASVGAALETTEDAARMRVERALERLRQRLARRDIRSSMGALALVLGQHAVSAAPSHLAASLTVSSLAAVATATTVAVGTTAPLATGTATVLHFMNSTKIALTLATLVTVGAATTAWVEYQANQSLKASLKKAQTDLDLARAAMANAQDLANRNQAEFDQLKDQQVELMALRDKAAKLRESESALTQLRQQNDQLRLASQSKPSQPAPEAEESEQDPNEELVRSMGIARLNYTKGWGLAFFHYSQENGGRLPASFEAATAFYPQELSSFASLFDQDRFEIVYQGELNSIQDPARTILVREKEPFVVPKGDGTFTRSAKTYLFADGHTEIYSSPNGDFTAWENQRMVAPAP